MNLSIDDVGAADSARRAAQAAGLAVRELVDPADQRRLTAVFDAIWGRADEQVLPAELLRVLAFECGYLAGASVTGASVTGAEPGPGDLVAASVGLFGRTGEGETVLHSHVTGALGPGRERHAGFVLKQHQRAWCLARGLSTVQWTFDPLVRRNAYFNAVKLGALPVAYLPDFYGEMSDAINAGQPSDRFLVRWPLRSAAAVAAAAGRPVPPVVPAGTVVLLADRDGRPALAGSPDGAPAVLVATPADIETVRLQDPRLARSWRAAHREVLPDLLENGWRVTGLVDRSSYLLSPAQESA